MKKFCEKVLLFISLWLFLMAASSVARPAEKLSVDLNTVVQHNFLGINAIYHAFTYMPESVEQGMTDKFRKIEFQRLNTIGIHIVRTFYRPDWAMGDEAWSVPDWQSVKMQALYRWLAEMQKLNIDVALNMGWWFGRDVIWNRDQHLASYPDDMQHYISWVSESLHQIIQVRGFTNVKYIVMFTEPADSHGDLPGGKVIWNYYKEVLKNVQQRLVADGRRGLVKIIGPNTAQASRWVRKAAAELNDVIDIYDSHNYNVKTYQKWFEMAIKIKKASESTGKPFWVDEYGLQNAALRQTPMYGNLLAQANAAFLNAGAQTSMLWMLNDQYYPYPLKYISNADAFVDGLHKWGLSPWLPDSLAVRPAWYAFSMMSRLMGGGAGTEVYGTSAQADLQVAATGRHGSELNILVVNSSSSAQDYVLTVKGDFSASLYRYVYDPARISPAAANVRHPLPMLKGHYAENALPKTWFSLGPGNYQIKDYLPAKGVLIYSTTAYDRGRTAKLSGAADYRHNRLRNLPERSTQEPQLISASPGNLAQGRMTFASSSQKGYPSANVTDGQRLLYWSSKIRTIPKVSEFVTVDLGKIFTIRQVVIYPRSDRKELIGAGFPVDYSLELSKDGKHWHIAAAKQGMKQPDATAQIIKISPHKARFIRLASHKLRRLKNNGFAMQIAEIKAFGN